MLVGDITILMAISIGMKVLEILFKRRMNHDWDSIIMDVTEKKKIGRKD